MGEISYRHSVFDRINFSFSVINLNMYITLVYDFILSHQLQLYFTPLLKITCWSKTLNMVHYTCLASTCYHYYCEASQSHYHGCRLFIVFGIRIKLHSNTCIQCLFSFILIIQICVNPYKHVSLYECWTRSHGWSIFLAGVVLTNHVWVDFGCMQVNSQY